MLEKDLNHIIDITRALDNPVRVKILYYLSEVGTSNVNNIVNQFNVSQPAISKHLKILNDANLVNNCHHKQERIFQLSDNHVKEILDVIKGHIIEKY